MKPGILTVFVAMVCIALANEAQGIAERRACGSTVHLFPDPVAMPDPPLRSLPPGLQRAVEKALRPLLAEEAKITGADMDGSKRDDPKDALRMYRIGRDGTGSELYAAWWHIPIICGHHVTCPIWLLEIKTGETRNLVKPSAQNPAANVGGGWGIGVLPSAIPNERLLITSSGFAGPGHPDAEASCWRRQRDFYVSEPCPASCMEDLNRSNQ